MGKEGKDELLCMHVGRWMTVPPQVWVGRGKMGSFACMHSVSSQVWGGREKIGSSTCMQIDDCFFSGMGGEGEDEAGLYT